MSIKYLLQAHDSGSNQLVQWESTGVIEVSPTVTSPQFTGTLTNITVVGEQKTSESYVTSFLSANSAIGTTPFLVGTIKYDAGVHLAPKAVFGCSNPSHLATVTFKVGATSLITITGHDVAEYTAVNGFTLANTTIINLYLQTDNVDGIAFIYGVY